MTLALQGLEKWCHITCTGVPDATSRCQQSVEAFSGHSLLSSRFTGHLCHPDEVLIVCVQTVQRRR